MKPKITDFVNCDHLLFSLSTLSRITLIEVTTDQWRDATYLLPFCKLKHKPQ